MKKEKRMMKIKFSHRYDKLPQIYLETDVIAELLQVLKIDYNELSEPMMDDDTKYCEDRQLKHYPLPKGELILLVFRSSMGYRMFTTIRRFTPEKYKYYKSLEGKELEISMT